MRVEPADVRADAQVASRPEIHARRSARPRLDVWPYLAITASSWMTLKCRLPMPAYGATNSGVEPIGLYSSKREVGSEPTVPSMRSSEPEPTMS